MSAAIMLASLAGGCSEPGPSPSAQPAAAQEKPQVSDGQATPNGVANLPFSQGRAFRSLDEYLAFLRERGRYDVPWYREIRPGVYELVSRRGPGAQPRTYTRAELEEKFGFAP
jgi:hypothetical protein